MSYIWSPQCDMGDAYPNSKLHAEIECESGSPEQLFQQNIVLFVLRGTITTDVGQLSPSDRYQTSTTFFEMKEHASRKGLCFGVDFRIPYDSFEGVSSWYSAKLAASQLLPPSGPLGEKSRVAYDISVEVENETTYRKMRLSRPVIFHMWRRPFLGGLIARSVTQIRALGEDPDPDFSLVDAFICRTETPVQFVPGQKFALRATIDYDHNEKAFSNGVEVLGCSITLIETTKVVHRTDATVESVLHHPITALGPSKVMTPIWLTGSACIDVAACMYQPVIAPNLPPSFEIPQASRHYSLDFKLQIRIDRRIIETQCVCQRVDVLAATFAELLMAEREDDRWKLHHWSRDGSPDAVQKVKRKYGIL